MENEDYLDHPTGINNRRAYDEEIFKTLASVQRDDIPYTLMLCYIDDVDNIETTFGRKVGRKIGDLVIKKIATLLKERLRTNDFIARYAGVLFAVILNHTTLEDAFEVAEDLRYFINNSSFSYENQTIPVTISVGISPFRKDDDSFTVFDRAEQALYNARSLGGNIVETEEDQ